jgi:hypothetical protein
MRRSVGVGAQRSRTAQGVVAERAVLTDMGVLADPFARRGLITLAFSIGCPLSGHHTFGLWRIAQQLSVTAAMLDVSVLAIGRWSRTAP